MTKNQKITAAIKAELLDLRNDVKLLAAQFEAADTDAKKSHYLRLLTLAQDRIALLGALV